jgi:hypothetical protein
MTSLEQVIKESRVHLNPGRYAVATVKYIDSIGPHFAISQDDSEITVITEEENMSLIEPERVERWFKLIEIRVAKPFNAPGFLATIAGCMADRGLNVFIVSTFSKDYVLLREREITIGVAALASAGFQTSGLT